MQRNENCKEFNPKTLELIRNLRAMGCLSFAVHDIFNKHLMNWCFEKKLLPNSSFARSTMESLSKPPMPMLIDFIERKNLISFAINDLFERHLQEWCISKGIVSNDYIATFGISTVKDAEKTSIKCIICGKTETVEFPAESSDHKIISLFENKGWDMEKEKCPRCNQ
ncbi:hypothetical protein GWO43_09865 [candidate division KSB1 bacterium]|nr:hypothetical protein [candidate division KSB1 bacterium]NIR69504.1 hypothetical protein [candidate division KSB1 bacterium]NIS24272.1 hypothetical protein [candidate division KSB1 bacterium]NIT71187.1 hypothetical protein [candidate division KSB1 bacterium]NIU24891.1 hypothetical protein [candidate division KSB1 bacterium]